MRLRANRTSICLLPVCLLGVAVGALGGGCGGGGSSVGGPGSLPPLMQGWGNATPLGGTGVLTYAFTMDPADLDHLNETALQEIFVPAELTVSGKPVGKVGLRYKGSDGTLGACFENGKRWCPKLSFKVKFDLFDAEQRFEGLKRINLHSMLGDATQMHERLAYELFHRMGVEAPRATHAFVTINGSVQGLFGTAEDLDGRFTKDRWKEAGDGNLYKEAWPVEVSADNYTPFLHTNEQMPDNRLMTMFASSLFAAKPGELGAVINKFADSEQLLRYLAVDEAINDYDGVTAFYCDQTGKDCSNHNYYWYQHPTTNRFLLVPWDLTDTFFVSTPFNDVPAWNVLPADCGVRSLVEGGAVARAGCDLVFQGIAAAGRPAYDKALDRMLQIFDVPVLVKVLRGWASEIEPAVANDPLGPGLVAWKAALAQLEVHLGALRVRLEAIRASKAIPPFGLSPEGKNDFEDTNLFGFFRAVTGDANPHSGRVVRLSDSGALAGGHDARFDFELANEPVGAGANPADAAPWAVFRLPIAGGTADLRDASRLRLTLAADNVRSIRLDLDSPKYGIDPEDGVRYGKDLLVGKTPTEFIFSLSDLSLPDGGGNVSLDDVLSAASGLIFSPQGKGRNEQGVLPAGKTDAGFVRIDNVSFE